MYRILALDFLKADPPRQKISALCAAAPSMRQSEVGLNCHFALSPCGKGTPFPFLAFISSFALTFVASSFQIDYLKSRFTERVIYLFLMTSQTASHITFDTFVALLLQSLFSSLQFSVSIYYGSTFSK